MFGIFKRGKKAPEWNALSDKQKVQVATKLAKANRIINRARYKVVSGFDQMQREIGIRETENEDQILSSYERGRLLNLVRNAARNSPTLNGMLKQFDLNVVGTKGGKAIVNFADYEKGRILKDEFAKWTRSVDFFDGQNLNTILKIVLKTYLIGGDMVLLFDDGLVEDSGKLLIYEPDEIGNTTDEILHKRFGKFASQSQGRIYNANSRFVGVCVSRSQRGNDIFDPAASYILSRNPDGSVFDDCWLMPRNVWRSGQGRGVSQLASSIATLLDLEDLAGFELAAAKKNSQTIAQVLQTSKTQTQAAPSTFDAATDINAMSDSEIEAAIKAEADASEQIVTLDRAMQSGVVYQVMPEDYRLELLDTKHPNQSMPDFIRWLAGRSAAPLGLTRQYATMEAGANFRAEQLMSQRVFDECQQWLEQICDWVMFRWGAWARKKGMIKDLPENWISHIDWQWPNIDEADEVAH